MQAADIMTTNPLTIAEEATGEGDLMRRTDLGTASFGSIMGLREADVQFRLKTEGYNELPCSERRTPLRIILEVLREPMLALLLGGGAIYLLLGDLKDALILLAFATMSVLITVVQETRTERVLEALRDLTSPRALVIRDGDRKRVAGREVVRGDFIVLAEGDRVPADALLLRSHGLKTDESLLTGESVPVRKIANGNGASGKGRRPGGDDLPYVFSGSLVVSGTGIGEVIATGALSEIGKIGQSLARLETEQPRLQAQTRRLVRVFAMIGGAVSVLAVLLYGTLRGGWLDAMLAGIALGMSMLPAEVPVVLTVFMAMGAWRISRARVLTRRSAAIETLGSATVLCTDKTGTLTENRMKIAELRIKNGTKFRPSAPSDAKIPECFHDLVEFGILASARDPVDPMEKAFHDLGREQLAETEHLHGFAWKLLHTYGLRPGLLAMSHVWQAADGRQEFVIAAKGAPEAIADLCHLDAADRAALTQSVDAMAAEGLRVLGVARASFAGQVWPDLQHDFAFSFVGLVGLADPLRATVPDAVSECRSAGIKVVMITGDYPATARAIAPKRPPTGERGSAAASPRNIARDVTPRGTMMNATSTPQTASEQGRKNNRDVTTADAVVPESVRAMAERAVDQSREVYDRSKDALDASVATLERSFDAAGQGAVAFNRKIIDIAQRNVNSGFDLAKSLAGAKNLSEIVELQAAYWQKLLGALTSQAEEVRALSTKMAAAAVEPLKEQVKRGVNELRKAN